MNNNEFCIYISKLATKSLLYEVSATPKPGLVDRYNSGAHKDMDFFSFLNSSIALIDYFRECTMAGLGFSEDDYTLLLRNIRPIGIEAENNMFNATGGINTHKGLIFSIGVIAAAVGNIFKKKNTIYFDSLEISDITKRMTKGISEELYNLDSKDKLTYGERLYKQYGIKGVRGEVEEGFQTVLEYALPAFKTSIKEERHINDILVQTLLTLMANTEDGNILGRHDMETLDYVKEKAKSALNHGGFFTYYGKLYVEEMEKLFTEKNISPGGSADLLAITIMLYMLEKGDINDR